jgi:hypothetical protein
VLSSLVETVNGVVLLKIHFIRLMANFMRGARFMVYRGADKSLARLGRKQATATEDFDVHIPYS